MKYFISLFMIGLLFTSAVFSQNTDVTPEVFQKDLSNANVQILDVRTPGEYQNGHIKNALQADWLQQDQFKDRVQYLDKGKPVLLYCASGGRSGQAAQWLEKNGFQKIENLKGGFTQWKLENKPFEGAANVPQISMKDYVAYTKSSNIVLVDFGAEWCPPCKKMQPVIEGLQTDLKDKFKLVKVDGGINIDVMKQLNVAALPTFIVYKNGKEIWRKQGITAREELIKQLSN